MKHVNVLKRLGGILLCAILMLTLSAVAVAAEDEVKDVSEEAVAADSPVLTIGADDVSDFSENVAPSLTIDTDDATSEAATDVTVLVTIADANGDLVLAMEPVTVIDIDEDGLLTINDALYCAHEEAYEGGAAAGYASAMSDYRERQQLRLLRQRRGGVGSCRSGRGRRSRERLCVHRSDRMVGHLLLL